MSHRFWRVAFVGALMQVSQEAVAQRAPIPPELLTGAKDLAAQLPDADRQYVFMADGAKIDSWKGARVRILPPDVDFLKTISTFCRPNREFPVDALAGREGVITEVAVDPENSSRRQVLVQLEQGADTIRFCSLGNIGFFDEYRYAETFAGRTLWTRVPLPLSTDCSNKVVAEKTKETSARLEPLRVVGAGWGSGGRAVHLRLRRSTGREVCFDFMAGWLSRYLLGGDVRRDRYLAVFHVENPRTRFRGWSPAAWKAIEQGAVTRGMSLEMVALACGAGFRGGVAQVGSMVGKNGKSSPLFRGCGKQILVTNGRVAEVIDAP